MNIARVIKKLDLGIKYYSIFEDHAFILGDYIDKRDGIEYEIDIWGHWNQRTASIEIEDEEVWPHEQC